MGARDLAASCRSTTAPSPSRVMAVARAPFIRVTPRSRKSPSRTKATSGSRWGSTCWRLTTNVTSLPRLEKMWTNSTPVTPAPMITTCSGSSGRSYVWRVVRIRSPSTFAQSGCHGVEPVAIRAESKPRLIGPSSVSATAVEAEVKRPRPLISSTLWETSMSETLVETSELSASSRAASCPMSGRTDSVTSTRAWMRS